jgi:hypothetical protein
MAFKHVEISLMKKDELSIDGQTSPAGNIEIREFEDGEWTGGSYATYDNLVAKVREALDIDDDSHDDDWQDHGGEG